MPTATAYCSTCDTEVTLELEGGTVDPGTLSCRHDVLCEPEECVLRGMDAGELRDRLEFLPGGSRSETRGLNGVTRDVAASRRLSLAREFRRWKRWWRDV